MRSIAMLAVCAVAALPVCAAHGLTLAPGDSGTADGEGIGASGNIVASNSGLFTEALSDGLVDDAFVTSVTQMSSGELAFTYRLSPGEVDNFVTVPQTLELSGFAGVSTDLYVLAGTGNENTIWGASRSADGATLTLASGAGVGGETMDGFTVEVRTNATGYVYNPDAYQPTYWVAPYNPPGVFNESYLNTFDAAGYSPNLSAGRAAPTVPEPLAILTLPLALLAMGWRFRRRTGEQG